MPGDVVETNAASVVNNEPSLNLTNERKVGGNKSKPKKLKVSRPMYNFGPTYFIFDAYILYV